MPTKLMPEQKRKAKRNMLGLSIIIIVIGVLVFLYPESSMKFAGAVAFLFGVSLFFYIRTKF